MAEEELLNKKELQELGEMLYGSKIIDVNQQGILLNSDTFILVKKGDLKRVHTEIKNTPT